MSKKCFPLFIPSKQYSLLRLASQIQSYSMTAEQFASSLNHWRRGLDLYKSRCIGLYGNQAYPHSYAITSMISSPSCLMSCMELCPAIHTIESLTSKLTKWQRMKRWISDKLSGKKFYRITYYN